MKIERLIGIITLLLQNEKMTAPILAKRFEVSKRTINRDIEALCKAGIPIVTTQGINGGISIIDSYKIDKVLLTKKEIQGILTGLSSLDSVTFDKKYQSIIEKFSTDKNRVHISKNIVIDLSSHYKSTLSPKIQLLQASIEGATSVTFLYYNKNGERQVILNPYLLVFQWSSWYIYGFDQDKKSFRLFKLNRMDHLGTTNQAFDFQEIPDYNPSYHDYFTDDIQATILFDKEVKYRLVEEYGPNCYKETKDGQLLFSSAFTNEDYLLEWVLSFGDKAELIEPKSLRLLLQHQLENMLKRYRNDDI